MWNLWHLKYALLMTGVFAITVGYNACSSDATFGLRQDIDVDSFRAPDSDVEEDVVIKQPAPKITINDNAEFTTDSLVNLSLDPDGPADQMFISDDEDCATGAWEPFQENKLWTLKTLNQKIGVYVKYKNRDEPDTVCIKDQITHDNIAPVVNFTQGVGSLWLQDLEIRILYQATDSGSGVQLTECNFGENADYKSCSNNIYYPLLIENQHYQLAVRATDNAGNVSAPQQLNWRSDRTPPSVTFNSTPSAITADITPDFSFVGIDIGSGVSTYECKLDTATQYTSCVNNRTLENLDEGSHTLSVRVIDNVGLISAPISYTWIQNSMAPTIEFTQTPAAINNSGLATFAFSGIVGGIQSYRCKLNSAAYASCTSPQVIENLADGKHSFSVIGTDTAGNNSSPISYSWTIDSMEPTIAFSETPLSIESSTNARFSFVAQDSGSGIKEIQCRLDSAVFAPCSATKDFTVTPGSHTLYARSLDNAGNYSINIISYQWSIDVLAPEVLITSTPLNPTSTTLGDFSFNATDSGSGVDRLECRLDSAAYSVCTSPAHYEDLSDGQHIFSVRAYDKAGHISEPATYQWLIDTTAPVIHFVFQPNPKEYLGSIPKIRFIADDGNGSGVKNFTCLYNLAAYPCAGDVSYNIPVIDESDHTFQVTVFDNLGNNSTVSVQWTTSYQIIPKQALFSVEQENRPVDILFIVDNSISMDDYRDELAAKMDGFLAKVDGLDWQVAVTSTDLSGQKSWENGRLAIFNNNLHVLNSTMNLSEAQSLLTARIGSIPSGGDGSGAEQGIYATVKVITRALNPSGSYYNSWWPYNNQNDGLNSINASFIRSGANLAVVILSDEDENSEGTNVAYSPQQFLNFVDESYSSQKTVTFHSIITMSDDVACKDSGDYPHFYGVVYEELSTLTGGNIGSVCAPNYTAQLSDIGQSVIDMQKSFSLECTPVDDDNNGFPDMVVKYKAANSTTFVDYNGSFTIQGQKIVFENALPTGDYQLDFLCTE